MRALVVDDNDAFRALVSPLLRNLAAVVEQTADGATALHLARDLRPDLIVMTRVALPPNCDTVDASHGGQ